MKNDLFVLVGFGLLDWAVYHFSPMAGIGLLGVGLMLTGIVSANGSQRRGGK